MLKGKIAIVTGSTSGIGLGIAQALAAEGADIVLNGFGDAAAIDAVRKEIGARGVRVAYSAADMSKPAEVAGIVEFATRELGSVDILVNNAGIQFTAPVEEFPVERWDAIIAINLSAVFHGIRAALPQMKKRNWVGSSTSRRCTASSHRRRRSPMWQRSTPCSDSPRSSHWRPRRRESRATRSARGGC